jgi:tetratricopeptide (TPR) repeat protein/tRNA A-37 threonylcarbamoyl transferase component Bud32
MPVDNSFGTRNANVTDVRYARFEAAWLARRAGEAPPRWQDYLPAVDEPCSANLIYLLLQVDIECRIKAGLSALLTEHYFEHPRLQQPDARLDGGRQVELIRWEYMQRWQNGQRARRAEYQTAFPDHAGALHDLKPRTNCPRCLQAIDLAETAQTVHCPACESDSPLSTVPTNNGTCSEEAPGMDLRGYELIERLGGGGMGDVYRASDPALGRDLAVKVMKADIQRNPIAMRRFRREARVTGSLQHPGIVPVYNLGRLKDGRLHYTMRLVRGDTFADILNDKAGKPECWPALLAIFEKVCQAVAYAHSHRVIHRDLKPANKMVGRFGEVQVMDWGLAKLLVPEDEPAKVDVSADAGSTRIHSDASDTPVEQTRMGREMGTPAYMSPEQALGEWDKVDERADVFALGAILCEILTGQPPYTGHDALEALRRAKRGDRAEALARLDRCGADPALTALCRECLTPERESRPRDAEEVSKRVAAYQTEVQERLRRAELERAEAMVKVREERKRRRLSMMLAAMVLVLVVGGVAVLLWQQRQDARQRQGVEAALAEVERLQQQARWTEARAVLEQAESRLGEAGPQDLRRHLEQARSDLELVAQLDTIRLKRATMIDGRFDFTTADRDYEAAFRTAGIGEVGEDTAVVGERIGKSAVSAALVAFLDDWAVCTRGVRRDWVLEVARKADRDPIRDGLRDPKTWNDGEALARLAETHAAEISPQLLVAVGARLFSLGRDAEPLLRRGQERYPTDFWIYYALGVVFSKKQKPEETVGYYRVALALRPRTSSVHVDLGKVLHDLGRVDEAITEYHKAIELDRNDAMAHSNLSNALKDKGRLDEAITEAQKAIELDPKYAKAHNNLGAALYDKGRLDEAIEECRTAIRLDPNYAKAHANLGFSLHKKGRLDEALTACQRAVKLDPKIALVHRTLGAILYAKGRLDEASACYRQAIDLDPKNPGDHLNLGNVLYSKRNLDGAIACLKKAIDLDPNHAAAHSNLSNVLRQKRDLPGAIAHARKAINLNPKLAEAHHNLGIAFLDKDDLDAAIPCFRRAIDIDPKYVMAYNYLGAALYDKGDVEVAISCFRKAIDYKPDFALPYINLSNVLREQAHFTDALAAAKKGLDQLPSKEPTRKQLQQLLQDCQRLVMLEARLPAVLRGTEKPDSATEQIEFARLCALKKRNRAATRLYANAFATEPNLAADLKQQHRYNAACSAALAASGQSQDAARLDDKERAHLRQQAFDWLRADLALWIKQTESAKPDVLVIVQRTLQHWRKDTDLASLRDAAALNRLPENERAAWQALWRDVDELLQRVAEKKAKP